MDAERQNVREETELNQPELNRPRRPPQADDSSIEEVDLDDDLDVDDLDVIDDDDIIDDDEDDEKIET